MTDWVADYSWARPDPHWLRSAGCIGVMRYLGPGGGGRDLTGDERRRLHDAGLGIGLVWETTTTAALAGWQAGAHDFAAANRFADAQGYPDDMPIFFAVDTDVSLVQVRGPVADTFHGALSNGNLRPCRPYGEHDVLDILCGQLKLMPCGWQCYAWSGGRQSAHRCLFQRYPAVLGGTVDHNEVGPHPVDFLWHPTNTYQRGDDVLTQEDWDRMQRMISEGVRVGVEAATNIEGNLAGVTRDEGGQTRTAGVADGDATRKLITELDHNKLVELEAVQSNLAGVLKEFKDAGALSGDFDVAQVAERVAASLGVIVVRPPP
jgi:hypothetical protein